MMDRTNNPNYYFSESPYKSKYICTDCRKSFKRKIFEDNKTQIEIEEKAPKCPDCGNPTSWIGPKFRAPKKDNINAWNSVSVLNDIGILHFIGWPNETVILPESKKALQNYLRDLKIKYECNVKKWITTEYSTENKNQIKHFSEAVKKIDKHLLYSQSK
jgi:DNA-directed RNA polymerase subunit RPC12/RpoP